MMDYKTLRVEFRDNICFIQIYRPELKNTINEVLVEEFHQVLDLCENSIAIVVIEGLPDFFCFGADFQGMYEKMAKRESPENDPEPLYDLWMRLAMGPYITISHIKGKANAGGVGFIAASDIVIAGQETEFSLSELLFGLFPACVMPFLIRRIGFQNAHYMTLMTQPVNVQQAHSWRLVDAFDPQSESLLRRYLLRLKRLSKTGVLRYKRYMGGLNDLLVKSKPLAIASNKEVFSDVNNQQKIFRYVEKGLFPWEE